MISYGEVKRNYEKLMNKVVSDEYYKKIDLTNRVNCYKCTSKICNHITKTKDIDAGVTPMMFHCEKCEAQATSTFYNDIAPVQQPTYEWYRPGLKELFKLRKKPGVLEHIFSGGLSYRKIEVERREVI